MSSALLDPGLCVFSLVRFGVMCHQPSQIRSYVSSALLDPGLCVFSLVRSGVMCLQPC